MGAAEPEPWFSFDGINGVPKSHSHPFKEARLDRSHWATSRTSSILASVCEARQYTVYVTIVVGVRRLFSLERYDDRLVWLRSTHHSLSEVNFETARRTFSQVHLLAKNMRTLERHVSLADTAASAGSGAR